MFQGVTESYVCYLDRLNGVWEIHIVYYSLGIIVVTRQFVGRHAVP